MNTKEKKSFGFVTFALSVNLQQKKRPDSKDKIFDSY